METVALFILAVQSAVFFAAGIGLVIYGSRWIGQREDSQRTAIADLNKASIDDRRELDKLRDQAFKHMVSAVESIADQASVERKELLDRIQSPLAPHVQAMANAVPPPVDSGASPLAFEDGLTPHVPTTDPNLDIDLMIAHARNGDD